MRADLNAGTKICGKSTCPYKGCVQPVKNFHMDARAVDKLQYCCKTCINQSEKVRRDKRRKPKPQPHPGFKFCSQKTCPFLGKEQPLTHFYRDKNTKDGFGSKCKTCKDLYYKNYHLRYKEVNHIKTKAYSMTAKSRYNYYKRNASRRHLEFVVTFEEFMVFWQKPCVYGCPIDTVGLDRVDSSKGYTLDNVVSMCYSHNQMKSDRSLQEFECLCSVVTKESDKKAIPCPSSK